MAVRVDVKSEVLGWAVNRSGLSSDELTSRFPRLAEWRSGTTRPTLKQIEEFASVTRTPVGYLFLSAPPEEHLPIPDFRTVGDERLDHSSPDLLDTIHLTQQRQEWYRNYILATGERRHVPWVDSCTLESAPSEVAARMRDTFRFQVDERGGRWVEAFRILSDRAEEAGVLIMVNGVVGTNTHRKLDPQEFRGFALVDSLAPTVFVNGADTRAAQVFTLAHELAHLWLGQSALDNASLDQAGTSVVEKWCNQVAAEFLVPMTQLRQEFMPDQDLGNEVDRLARRYKVSTLVILRRLYEGDFMSLQEFRAAFRDELERVLGLVGIQAGDGGNFYNTQPVRVSKTFARAVISDTLTGRTTYSDAFRMLGLRKSSTFTEMAHRLGVA